MITLTVSVEQYNAIRQTLGQLPHDKIGGLIQHLEQQVIAQQQTTPAPLAKADEAKENEVNP